MIIIDDFVKDEALLQKIANDPTFFSNNGKYYWWDGFWQSEANTVKKELIQYLWGERSPHRSMYVYGFEYWTGQLGDGHSKELPIHTDKDEMLWDTTGKVQGPSVGTVFYPVPMDIDGGYLEIYTKGLSVEPERVEAKFNRMIIFDAGGVFHRVTPVTRGVRSAIAINLWEKSPVGLGSKGFSRE